MHTSHVLPASRGPLAKYGHAAVVRDTQLPVPLVATSFSASIHGGLALVRTARTFRNAEAKPIEATMTFPVPVRATLLGIAAEVDGRRLTGKARRKQMARNVYEDGLERGKAVVLHEEVLRGVHMISVGNIAPGAEIVVSGTWAMPLSAASGNRATLRIPVTVGDVYGISPLPESDDLAHGGSHQEAELVVSSDAGTASVRGVALDEEGRARIVLDAPIDIEVTGWQPNILRGTAADGRAVALEIIPAPHDDQPLDAAILADRSGSMGAANSIGLISKLEAVRAGLAAAAETFQTSDRLDLWEFNTVCNRVQGASFEDAVARMQEAAGGTGTGVAITTVLASRATRDVLILTDGKSHALNVQAAARSGRRFFVVLIGEDSLEAHVGHLAALTGGQVFVASGTDIGEAILQGLQAMRAPSLPARPIEGAPVSAETLAGGMRLRATWMPEMKKDESDADLARAVAAVAASLAIPHMEENTAAALAEAEGILCHLTSLVLVDEAGEAVDGIAAQRKVATMTPRVSRMAMDYSFDADVGIPNADEVLSEFQASFAFRRPAFSASGRVARFAPERRPPAPPAPPPPLRSFVGQSDWSVDPDGISRGDLSSLPAQVAQAIRHVASLPEIVALAAALGKNPLAVAAALLAQNERWTNRSAARLAKAVLKGADHTMLDAAKKAAGG